MGGPRLGAELEDVLLLRRESQQLLARRKVGARSARAEVLDLARGRSLDTDRWLEHERAVAATFAEAFGGSVHELASGAFACQAVGRLLVVCHPLEDHQDDRVGDRLAEAVAEAEAAGLVPLGGRAEAVSSFDLLRRPGAVVAAG